MLLVLDNFEHVLDAALDVSELLASCPKLKVLATSRAPLRLYGEQEFQVPPLELPGTDLMLPIARFLDNEAVSLFTQRARGVRSDFELTEANARAVVEICRRLDGLPLAIELAAARVKLLSPQAILPRLGQRLALLTGGPRDLPARQRTMRDTIDWSYNLLHPAERVLFARLAVFVGGRSLEAIEAVCHTSSEASDLLDRLGSLVDMSLLRVGEDAQGRFWMLETISDYAAEKLEQSGEEGELRRRHAQYYLELGERTEPELDGPQQAEWLDRLEAERDNLRAALAWALQTDSEIAARLCSALWLYWCDHGHILEGRRWMEAAVARARSLPAAIRTKLLNAAGDLAWSQADYTRATQLLEEALGLARQYGGRRAIALSLIHLGNVALYRGEYERAIQLLEESLLLEREDCDRRGVAASLTSLGAAVLYRGDCERAVQLLEESLSIERQDRNRRGIAAALTGLGNAALQKGEYERAAQLLQESLTLKRQVGNKRGTAISLNSMARVALHQGDDRKAEQLLQGSLALAWQLGDKHTIASSLELLCQVAAARRDTDRATRLGGAAEALRQQISITIAPVDSAHHDRYVRELRSQMGPRVFTNAWEMGLAATIDEVVESSLATGQL
ncbi:MAG: tetratricopeptide repeat protein, partial [Chloroflexota bacterium]|nr:tetratricopeptide repeat protein [Chloroflexota bacterium]